MKLELLRKCVPKNHIQYDNHITLSHRFNRIGVVL